MADRDEARVIRTVCPAHCGIDACGILAHVEGGRVVKVEPAEFPDPSYRRICLRGLSSLDITYHPDRLKYPLKRVGERGEGKFERISWDEALDTVADKFKDIAARYGWPAIGWTLGGPGAGTTKFGAYLRLASLTQSTRVSAWGYGDAALPCGSRVIFGAQFPYGLLSASLNSDPAPDMVIAWGTNPAESQPLNMMRRIMDAKDKGAFLVVIDPRFTVTASKADCYVGLRPGTDSALALGLLNVIFEGGLEDSEFILRHTVGPYLVKTETGEYLRGKDLGLEEDQEYVIWDSLTDSPKIRSASDVKPALSGSYTANGHPCRPSLELLKELASKYPAAKTAEITGVSADLITKLGERLAKSDKAAFVTHMGVSRTYHGDISIRSLSTVASVTGNIQATFRGGRRPAILNWDPFLKADPTRASYSRLGILQLYNAVIQEKPYPVKAVYFAFINFLNQCADSGKIIREMFPKLELIVAAELFMTPTARYADILLPTTSYLEFSDFIAGPYPYLQLQQKVVEPVGEARSDVDIAAGLAQRLGYGHYYEGGEDAFIDLILDSPALEGVTRKKLMQGPMTLEPIPDLPREVDVKFRTPSGKIELYSEGLRTAGEALPVYLEPYEAPVGKQDAKYPLTFVQGHSRFRTHSMFANVESLLEMNPGPVIEINPVDAEERGISDNEMVTVYNDRGRTTLMALVTEGVGPRVVNISEGWWLEQFREGSVNHLTHDVINPVQEAVYEPNMHMNDVAVEVVKNEEVE